MKDDIHVNTKPCVDNSTLKILTLVKFQYIDNGRTIRYFPYLYDV